MNNPQPENAPLCVMPNGRLGNYTASLDYPNYLFYTNGLVYNLLKKRFLKTQTKRVGAYPKVRLVNAAGVNHTHSLYAVIAAIFLGPKPIGFVIDHRDGDRTNAAIQNLRYVQRSHNNYNRVSNKNSSSQYVGVVKRANSYEASIKAEGQTNKYLGKFATEEAAATAYQVAKASLHSIPTVIRIPVL